MNKRKLQEFASWAKENLETQIKSSLAKIGINSEKDIKPSRIQGDITIIGELETSFPKEFYNQRESIVKRIKEDGYEHSIEQFASTWFNRIVALRFLEVHNYLEHGYKIFPRKDEQIPEILSKLNLVKHDLALDMEYCNQLSESSKFEDKEVLYRYVLFQQCNSLAASLPMLFSQDMKYLEYFIPTPLLFGNTIVTKIIEIDEQDFLEDVEVIGWLYQFYIASKKDAVFASKNTITKDTLPAVTQLFTPDWIVKYMAENSIGRIWLESYPNSSLRDSMKYYVEEAKQDDSVEEQLKAIRYSNVNPEDIKVIEPCSGSGHILIYCFDLLLDMYLEKGYSIRDIPRLIFKNNLVGLDIDQRATQLASFALVMRARSIDNKFFDEGRYVRARVYEVIDSKSILNVRYDSKSYRDILKEYNDKQWYGENQLTIDELQTIEYVVNLFDNAKVIGSLLKVKSSNYLEIRNKLKRNLENNKVMDVFTAPFFSYEIIDLLEILRLAHYLSIKYDVMITNPPYCGISVLEDAPKRYLEINYPESKADMFAMFMDNSFVKEGGLISMINMHNWMFIDSYTSVRKMILSKKIIYSLVHLGIKAFEEIGNDVVQTCTFILRNFSENNYQSKFIKLVDIKDFELKQKEFYNEENLYIISASNFLYTPTYMFAFWVEKQFFYNFKVGKNIEHYGTFTGSKNITGNNDKFLRYFWEVNRHNISKSYWVPYAKGGFFRKYYGNIVNVVDWRQNAREFYKNNKTSNLLNEEFWYKSGITYSAVTSRGTGFRYLPEGCIFDYGGPAINTFVEFTPIILALLNSKVANYYFNAMNPSINLQTKDIRSFPIIVDNNQYISDLSNEQIELSKLDWSERETSFEFARNILVAIKIENKINYLRECFSFLEDRNYKLRASYLKNEIEINNYFKKLYELNSIEIDFEERDISIRKVKIYDEIRDLVSFLIGVLYGRYSLIDEGLIYAGGTFDNTRYGTFDIDKDGIIPIYSDISIEDGLVHRIIGLIKSIYGEEYYRENIDFIASALGKKSSETSEETLNRYLNDGFYVDHLKVYKKRPIYWMFSSGKKSGFKALIYMHRYDENTLAKINAGYFQPATTIIRNQINEIETLINHASEREKIQLERRRLQLVEQLEEATEYGQVLDYMANKYIGIDLDDGVKVNYAKFQNIEITTNNGKVKRNLLVSIK